MGGHGEGFNALSGVQLEKIGVQRVPPLWKTTLSMNLGMTSNKLK